MTDSTETPAGGGEPAGKGEGRVVGQIGPSNEGAKPETAAPEPAAKTELLTEDGHKPDPVSLFVYHAKRWIALRICNALGVTYAMAQMKELVDGLRRDLEAHGALRVKQASQMQAIVGQTNSNTMAIMGMQRKHAVWEQVDAQLGRASKRMAEADARREREAKAQEAAKGNDTGEPPAEETPEQQRRRLLEEEIRRETTRALDGHAGAKLLAERMQERSEIGGGKTVLMFRGQPMSDEEIEFASAIESEVVAERNRTDA